MATTLKKQTFKILIVEDHHMFREWLGKTICEEGTFTVCGEADNIQSAFTLIQQTHPDIVLLDITLRGSSGLELLKNMKSFGIETPVLVLSMHDESLFAERALRAGAKGYITKYAASSTLFDALKRVLSGKIYLEEEITSVMLEKMTTHATRRRTGMEALADRELEVFQLIGKGRKTVEIAEELSLGESTIETYRARIKEKLQLRNFAELQTRAAQWVQEQGL